MDDQVVGFSEDEKKYYDHIEWMRISLETDLSAVFEKMHLIAEHPMFRSRKFSLAITNVEQGMHWLGIETGS